MMRNTALFILVWAVLSLIIPSLYAQEQALSQVADTANTIGGQLITQVGQFREQARSRPEDAFVGFAGSKGQKLFGPLGRILCPSTDPSKGWAYFFETSVFSVNFTGSKTALALFYHPYSDVALITEWTQSKTGSSITDAELLMGDSLRNQGKSPYDLEPHWLRSPVPPYMAASMSSAQTIRDFQRIFSGGGKPFKGKWRSVVMDSKLLKFNQMGVGFMFERNMAGLIKLQDDAGLEGVRQQANAVLSQLQQGRAQEVLQSANQTRPESRQVIEQYAVVLGEARAITFIIKKDDQKNDNLFILYSVPGQPEYLMSFWLKADTPDSTPTINRIDLVDQNKTFVNFDEIYNALKIHL